MREKIIKLIDIIQSKKYDNEDIHAQYDRLLEEFILKFDVNLWPLMRELIRLEKDFWYA